MKHQIWRCLNPECILRFAAPDHPDTALMSRCPRCGSSIQQEMDSYEPMSIPSREDLPETAPDIVLILDHIRSALNVGAMFRTAESVGVQKIYLCGITPTPTQEKVAKTALGAENRIEWAHDWLLQNVIERVKTDGFQVWALEGGQTAENLFRTIGPLPPRQKIALVVGNEVTGVDPACLALADRLVYLPMVGLKESLNVATACGIALYTLRFGKTI